MSLSDGLGNTIWRFGSVESALKEQEFALSETKMPRRGSEVSTPSFENARSLLKTEHLTE